MSETSPAAGRELARRPLRLSVGDVDGARTVYFAAPFGWSEALWSDWCARETRPLSRMFEEGFAMPVVATGAEFHLPLRQDDLVELVLHAERVGRTSLTLRTEIHRSEGGLAAVVRTTHVFVADLSATQLRPAPLPDWLRGPLLGEGAELGG